MKISGHIECLKSAPGSPVRNPAGRSGAGLSSIELDVAHASVLSRNCRSASLRELRALTAYDHLVPTAAVMAGRRDAQGSVIRGSARVRARERAMPELPKLGAATHEARRHHAHDDSGPYYADCAGPMWMSTGGARGAPVRGGDFKVKESPSRREENTPARGQPPRTPAHPRGVRRARLVEQPARIDCGLTRADAGRTPWTWSGNLTSG